MPSTLGKSDQRSVDQILGDLLRLHPWLPSLALARSIELRALRHVSVQSPVLDLGCGNGATSRALFDAKPLGQMWGLDSYASEARLALHTGLYEGCMAGDAVELPFHSSAIGSVLSICVIEHIPNQEQVLAEVSRVLRPGGAFVFTTLTEKFPEQLHQVKRMRRTGQTQAAEAYIEKTNRRLAHFHYRPLSEWTRMIEAAGMQLVHSKYLMPAPVTAFWSWLDDICTMPFKGMDLYLYLRLGRRFKAKFWNRVGVPVALRFLKPWVLKDCVGEEGGFILLRAIKIPELSSASNLQRSDYLPAESNLTP